MDNAPINERKEQIDNFKKMREELLKMKADIHAIKVSMDDTKKGEASILAQLKELAK